MGSPHVIVWDLDGTIGDFYALEKHCDSNTAVTIKTRPGLAESLSTLSRAGFVHTLLTMATPTYAEAALRGSGLRDHFALVEGQGKRCKGDVEGLARFLGIPAAEVPSRFLFVGDRMMFDEPNHPHVVFHLELLALTRPASELECLVLHLRTAGNGSLREGFRVLGLTQRKWYRLWRRQPQPIGQPVRGHIDGLGSLLLLERQNQCPVIGFEGPPTPAAAPEEHSFVPSEVAPWSSSSGRPISDC